MELKTFTIKMNQALMSITPGDMDTQPKEIKSTPKAQVKNIKDNQSPHF
jgi:hypothetical protein